MKTLFLNKKYYSPKYYILDAQNNILGRFATKISNLLQGKDEEIKLLMSALSKSDV